LIDLPKRLLPHATGRTLLALLLAGLAFNLVLFPWRTSELRALSGLDNPILDAQFSYSAQTAFDAAAALGPQGRTLYALSELSLDLVYPILYSLFLSLLMLFVLRRLVPPASGWLRLGWLPFAVLACDYAENAGLVYMLLTFPAQAPAVVQAASLFTMAKWTLAALAIMLVLAGGVLAVVRRLMPVAFGTEAKR
jgi:hypothetical protein